MQHGKDMLGRRHVLPSVAGLLHEIQVEGTFVDGYGNSSRNSCLVAYVEYTVFFS